MAISGLSSLSSLYNLIYEDALFVARETNVMTNLVTNYSSNGWMARKISTYPEVSASSVADGVDFANATTFNKTLGATLTPGEVIAQVILTDQRIDTDPDEARRDAATELGNAVSTKIDTDLVSLFASFSTDKGAGAGSSATIAKASAAVAVLRNNKVPMPIYACWHPYHWHKSNCALAA